jgi:MFS family permease
MRSTIGFTVEGFLASQLVGLFGWPAIFVTGGVLPLAMVPLLALWLPESAALREATHRHNLVAALFQSGLARVTVLLWAINLLSLLGVFFILQWTPAILHSTGVSSTLSGAANIRRGCHCFIRRNAVDGDPRAIAAQSVMLARSEECGHYGRGKAA